MLSVHDSSYTTVMLFVVVSLVALTGVSGAVGPTTVDQTTPPQNTSDEHTVVIETTGEPVQYTISTSGSVSGDSGESDTVQGQTLNGRVGGVPWDNTTNDTEDTVRYTGYIETFQHRGDDLQLRLDGQQVSPAILSANHLRIVHPNSSNGASTTPVNYEISVTGDAVSGESTENQDGTTAQNGSNGTLIQGQLDDRSDSFYFTGNTTVRSFDRQALVFVNDQNVTASDTPNETPASTAAPPTATSTASPPTTSSPATTTTSETPVPEPTTDLPSTSDVNETVSSDSSDSVFGFLMRLVSGIVVIALAVSVAWYYFPRQQRW